MESWSISSSKSAWDRPGFRSLAREFYARDTLSVAPDLLGKILFVKTSLGISAGRIVETEAYREGDPASHCSRGRTPRASIMFGEPGFAYVYFIYGMYEMLNFVTEPAGSPGAVLIRAIEPVLGEDLMMRRRKVKRLIQLTNGPGKLTRALGIQMNHNGDSLSGPRLMVIDDGFKPAEIYTSPRVGINVGVEKLWRYYIADHSFVSSVSQNKLGVPFKQLREIRRKI